MKKTRLSDIFNADSVRNRKRILDRFEINKKEKRLFLDAIEEIENNEGGSGDEGGSDGGDKYMYWDISNTVAPLPEDTMLLFVSLSSVLFVNTTLGKMYAPSSFFIMHFAASLSELYQNTLKIAFNMRQQCRAIELGDSTIGDFMRSQGLTDEKLLAEAGISVITEKEFYTL